MVRITVDLVRKRAEHNEMVLSTLEELSLHQLDIEKIEYLHRWCPRLKILLMQGNLIAKIENMRRFRDLQYLNLALNNLEYLSGLENCESLIKLDLTGNFIIYLTSLSCLQDLSNLTELFLIGNPCSDYRGYRSWILCLLVPLEELDGTPIVRSDRIKAIQNFTTAHKTVLQDQDLTIKKREAQKLNYEKLNFPKNSTSDSEESDDEAWGNEMTEHSPEVRLSMHKELKRRRARQEKRDSSSDQKPKKEISFFNNSGQPLNLNKANVDFIFKEDEELNAFTLEVKTFKYLDMGHLTCDVDPHYVRVIVKGLPLQIVFPSEVKSDESTAKRSQVTGHLLITAPKVEENSTLRFLQEKRKPAKKMNKTTNKSTDNYLEIDGETLEQKLQICSKPNVDSGSKLPKTLNTQRIDYKTLRRPDSPDFQDDPEVPPLE